MTALPYLLTASLYLLLFYGCYALLLRRNTFFGLNRAYLLATVGLSLLLPLAELPDWWTLGTQSTETSILLPTFVVGRARASTENPALLYWFWTVYGLGVGSMFVRLRLNLQSVFRLIRRGTTEQRPNYVLVCLPDDSTPSFSFGRYLVLNQTDSLTEPDALMRHEEAHIRQYHTADVLFLEFVQALFWFNPVVWFYKQAIREVHEFLADRAVLKTPQPDYPRQLVAYALNVPATALTTPFVSKSTLKQRIIMLQKPQTHRRALLGYVLSLPLAGLLVMCTQTEQDLPKTNAITQGSARKAAPVDSEIFTVVEQQPEFPGGMEKLGDYLEQNLRYPEAAQKAKAQGRVFVSFIVTKTGEVDNVNVLKGIGFGADEEAVRVVSEMPRWTPAKQSGHVVNVRYNLPINFQLQDSREQAVGQPENTSSFHDVKHFLIDGEEVSKKKFSSFPPDKIATLDVRKDKSGNTVAIRTK